MENKINEETVKKDIARLKFSMQENNIIHNSYQREKRELECIRQGDMEGMEKCITEPYGGKLGTLSRDVLRSDKNVAMCAMAIYARAAIDGGIISDEAFSAGDSWAIRIDEAKSREEVACKSPVCEPGLPVSSVCAVRGGQDQPVYFGGKGKAG